MRKAKWRLVALLCITAVVGLCAFGMAACVGGASVNGVALGSYTVVYPIRDDVAKQVSEEFCAAVKEKYGVRLARVSDISAERGREILFGSTSRLQAPAPEAGKYAVTSSGGKVQLASGTSSGLIAAAQRLFADIQAGAADYREAVTADYNDMSMRVMSFNVRTADVKMRIDRVTSVIARNDPDILGVQEASSDWFPVFRNLEGYTCVGVGRDAGGGGEACFALFKTDKFNLIESGTRWYTDTPDEPSVLEGSSYKRIYTYALLERKTDGLRFLYVNTHMHLHLASRLTASGLLLEFLNDKYAGVPTYITGDFNTGRVPEDDPDSYDDFDSRLETGGFENARLIAGETDEHITYPTDLYPADAGNPGDIIDYCMIRDCAASDIIATHYRVDTAIPDSYTHTSGYGDAASDHYPIVADTLLYTRFR